MIELIVNIMIGSAGVLVALAVYSLTKQQMRTIWIQTFNEIHSIFWNDEQINEIRKIIAYDHLYTGLESVLKHRRELYEKNADIELLAEEVELLDKLDKYLNLLERVVFLRNEYKHKKDLWKSLSFHYWLQKCLSDDREDLAWYLKEFYSNLVQEIIGN